MVDEALKRMTSMQFKEWVVRNAKEIRDSVSEILTK